ncbi:hypothetical protein G7K_2466-t1 [Saitoella complicata NRRL Y-17804]|uniref:Uncharacterized protein n=1 Tax=Saitoella complicata (strain BCRC 22490 / CBS 7301 / JCM 7358 / NBRC 10748 / NRRL Y-17804) TaxID=698492 RepID=A0A0E9NEP6_SAICN|nr:hypothetical protein G7K_2466-t1 [Saitoella complicata NRRL Y-17804]
MREAEKITGQLRGCEGHPRQVIACHGKSFLGADQSVATDHQVIQLLISPRPWSAKLSATESRMIVSTFSVACGGGPAASSTENAWEGVTHLCILFLRDETLLHTVCLLSVVLCKMPSNSQPFPSPSYGNTLEPWEV